MSILHRYYPILKAKRGELRALNRLSTSVCEAITPVLEVVPPQADPSTGKPKKSVPDHLRTVCERIADAWGNYAPCMVDFGLLNLKAPKRRRRSSGLTLGFQELRQRGVKAVPVTSLWREAVLQSCIADTLAQDQCGVCLRLNREDFTAPDRDENIDRILRLLDCPPESVDLLVDFGPLSEPESKEALVAFCEATATLSHLARWRSFIFAGSSFPSTLPGDRGPVQCRIVRGEWLFWLLLNQARSPYRHPDFADYGVVYPRYQEFKPRKMKASRSNIRYTGGDSWLVLRSASAPRTGSSRDLEALASESSQAHHLLCQKLVAMPDVFCGANFSRGDEQIEICAANPNWHGDSSAWIYAGSNHHVTQVVRQLASVA